MCNQMYGHGSCSRPDMRVSLALLLLLCAATARADKASVERYFQSLDLNGDGYVSLSEAAGDKVVVQRFDKADKNRDGKLSEKEFANLGKVKLRVAKGRKDKDDVSAAAGGTKPERLTRAERQRQRMLKAGGAEAAAD